MPELAAARAVGAAHAAAADPARWAEVLDALCEALSADTAAFGLRDAQGRETGALCPRTDPAWHARYRDDGLARTNVLWAAAMRVPAGSATTDGMALPRDAYLRSDIYNGFIRPQGMDAVLTLTLSTGPQGTALMTFGRRAGRDGFSGADLDRAGALARLISGAAATACAGGAAMFGQQLDRLGAATFTCDGAGRMLSASHAAEALLAEGTARLTAGRLSLPGVPDLPRTLARATRPRDTWPPPMGTDLAAPGLSVRVAPWCGGDSLGAAPPLALVILRRTGAGSATAAALSRRFGLTATEARIAADLATGATLPEAAHRAAVRLTTARTHLQHIFDKTGVRSQVALVALLRPGDWPDPLP
jgi:DNA-binding CsgD family transcriptional regulator